MAKVSASYELMVVISISKGEEAVQDIWSKFKALIEKNAELGEVDEWGKRKLAYLINKESEGYYVLINFESEAEFPAELDRIYKITDGIMRSLIIKKPEATSKVAAKADEQENSETAQESVAETVVEETAASEE